MARWPCRAARERCLWTSKCARQDPWAMVWCSLAALLAGARSEDPELPEGQPCPTTCTDLSSGCPRLDEPVGNAPELYVGDPYNVRWPDGAAHAQCQLGANRVDCCVCGGGSVPDGCPEGHELQFTLRSSGESPESVADQIGALAWRVTPPDLLRRDLSNRTRDRVRIVSIEPLVRAQVIETSSGDDRTVQVEFWVVTFYFAAWYRWFPPSTDLENAFWLEAAAQSLEVRPPDASRPLPPVLRVAPPWPEPPAYPNSIAYAEYQAGVGREEPVCVPGKPRIAENCLRRYTHKRYPPETRDLTRTIDSANNSVGSIGSAVAPRPLVPGGAFVFPPCANSHNSTWAYEDCPVEDTTYCDEFLSLDLDCDGVLSLGEAAETTTWFDEPSFHGLTPISLLPRTTDGFTEMLIEAGWRALLSALDDDGDGYLSMFDWLKGSRVYKPTYQHCGEVLADRFFRYINQQDRSLGGDNGAYPIRACSNCPTRWIYCDLDTEGGGWNLVYESVGRTDFLMSTGEVNVERLWDPEFGSRTLDRYEPYRTQDTDTQTRRGPVLSAGKDPQGAKLNDETIEQLCDGQYMIQRHGQHPTFCRFVDISQYGDDAESVKACSFDHDSSFRGYQTLEPELGSSFGFSTGLSATGVGTFGFVAQLGYLWGPGGHYTLANAGKASEADVDYGASSHW